MQFVDARRQGSVVGSLLVALVLSLSSGSASASQPPLLPVGPYDWAPPTPVSPPPDSYELPTDINYSVPPFNAPLPPAVNYPPPIAVPPATTPPRPCGPFGNECRDNPGPVAPYMLPEQAGAPDTAEPAAGGLRQALVEYDRRLGLGGGGAVIAAARDIAQGEYVTGTATFEVVADPSGRIRSARLQDASRDREGWQRFGEALHQERVTGMRAPERARAVWMILYVSAENELTSGQTSWWSPGVVLAFDLDDINARRIRTVTSRVLTEVWY
jgi:hypothetical protein